MMEQNFFERINVLGLITSVRGGSKLFQSLTDSHSAIISFPRTFRYTQFWKIAEGLASRDISEKFLHNYPRFFDGLEWGKHNILDRADQLGPDQNETFSVNTALFSSNFERLLNHREINGKNVFTALHLAYALARGLEISKLKYILYHIHDVGNLSDITQVLNIFGNTRMNFVFTTRHPVDGLNACLEWMVVQNMLSPMNSYYYEVFEFTSPLFEKHPDIKLKVVSLEKLRHNRQEIMKHFCQWLEIPFEEILLKSTIHGKSWKGNARKPLGDSLYSDAQMYKPVHFLEKNDLKILMTLFHLRLQSFGIDYPAFSTPWKVYLAILIPNYQEFQAFKKSLSPLFWFSVYKKARFNKQNFLYLFKIGSPPLLIYFYLKRVAFYVKNARATEDRPCLML